MKRAIAVGTVMVLSYLAIGTAWAESHRRSAVRPLPTRTIDLAFHDPDIPNVLRFFAEIGDVNIVYGEEVSGNVSLTLRRVRWDRALRAILQTMGLALEVRDNIIRIATQATFARERESQIDVRQHCLETAPMNTRIIRVSHARAEDVVEHVRATLTERGTVSIDERTNTLIVRDVDCPR